MTARSAGGMANNDTLDQAEQIQRLIGALEIIDGLREEMELWLGEAQDDSKRECLDNVVGHISAIEVEYRKRLKDLRKDASR